MKKLMIINDTIPTNRLPINIFKRNGFQVITFKDQSFKRKIRGATEIFVQAELAYKGKSAVGGYHLLLDILESDLNMEGKTIGILATSKVTYPLNTRIATLMRILPACQFPPLSQARHWAGRLNTTLRCKGKAWSFVQKKYRKEVYPPVRKGIIKRFGQSLRRSAATLF